MTTQQAPSQRLTEGGKLSPSMSYSNSIKIEMFQIDLLVIKVVEFCEDSFQIDSAQLGRNLITITTLTKGNNAR